MTDLFKNLTEEQLSRFDAFLNSLPTPRIVGTNEKGIRIHEDDFAQYRKTLERLKLEDPELYDIFLEMGEASRKNIKR